MIVKKTSSGVYKVDYNGLVFEVENMTEYNQGWTIKENDFFGEWLNSFDTKRNCLEWIENKFGS